ncbi:MAG: FlgD immunoglobulin-like domain containing protein [Candidatus Krumholzibacteriota bacterium]
MNRPLLLTVVAAAIATGLLISVPSENDTNSAPWADQQQAKLENALLHAEPGSDRAFKLQLKLDRLEAWRQDRPQPGFPDEFAQVLHDMRVPSDRTVPGYEPGYRFRELAKAPRSTRNLDKSLVWNQRGPGNVAGRARGIIVDPIDPFGDTWYIASVGGGVWKTTDAGTTWNELTDDMPTLAIQSIAMAASDNNVIYAGTGESYYNIDTMNGNGILKSTDRGVTWTPIASTINDPRFNNVSRIIISPTDPDFVVVSATVGRYKTSVTAESNIFYSLDGGLNWTVAHTEAGPRITQLLADPTDFSIQYAAVDGGGILKSTDSGANWTAINSGITDFFGRFEMAISPVNTDYLYVSAEGASGAELWVSWDAGANWDQTFESGGAVNWLGGQGWYDNTIICHPTDPTTVYVGGPELFSIVLNSVGSTTRTTTALASYWFPHPDHHFLQIVEPSGGGWYLLGTNDGGVTRTNSGVTGFTMPTDGMVTTQFYGVDKRPGASAYIGGTQDNGTWQSPDNPNATSAWTHRIGGDGYETSWHFDDPQKIMGGYQYNGLQRTTDGGTTWTSATNGLGDTGSADAPFITKIGKSWMRPDHVFAVGVSGVWRSTDFGANWSLTAIDPADWGPRSSFMDVRVSKADPDIVWAGMRMNDDGKINVSTDDGVSFSPTTVYTDATMGLISGMATHPTEPNTAYVLFSFAERPKILKTTDLGATWNDISGFGTGSVSTNGFPDVAVYDLVVWPNDPNHIWVGSEIGLIESLDGGATWALANNGFPSVGIWFMNAIEDEIVVGTHGRGIWSTTIPELDDNLTFNPLFESMVQSPSGTLDMVFNLRSVYDSTQVWIDGAIETTYGVNTAKQIETLNLPVLANGTVTAFARGFKGGVPHDSITRQQDVIALAAPAFEYTNTFDNDIDADDFEKTNFQWAVPGGFSDGGLHTDHYYANSSAPVAMLLQPIKIWTNSQLSFDEVAIIEPGESGSVFGDSDFWDYVIVEASSDGFNWVPLADGWDARDDSAWLSAYNSSSNGNSTMFRNRTFDLTQTYANGEVILLRFRLFADSAVTAWGWAIDNINVTSDFVSAVGDLPAVRALEQNYPNPFNPKTTIAFTLDRSGQVKLQVYDVQGHLVRTLVDGTRTAGQYRVDWDGRDNAGRAAAAGIYMYRMESGGQVHQRKMTLIK